MYVRVNPKNQIRSVGQHIDASKDVWTELVFLGNVYRV